MRILIKLAIFCFSLVENPLLYAVYAATARSDATTLQTLVKIWKDNTLNWEGGDPCGSQWQGVTCDYATNSQVIALSLSGVGLTGIVPPDIGNLVNLLTLDLSFNPNLSGTLPHELGKLVKLQTLNLQSCNFSGNIPIEISALAGLRSLALNKNHLIGAIPSSLGKLRNISFLDLSENTLSGILPVSSTNQEKSGLDNLTQATKLYLHKNSFSGKLPAEICNLPNLIQLFLNDNNFSGPLPMNISQLPSIQILRLNQNTFGGIIPDALSDLKTLYELDLSGNRLSGNIPDLSNLQQLKQLRLSRNLFRPNPIPTWLLRLTMLQTLEMDSINLIGGVPVQLLGLSSLETLSLQDNRLNGTLQINSPANSLFFVSFKNNSILNVTGLNSSNPLSMSLSGNPICNQMPNALVSKSCSTMEMLSSWRPPLYSCNISCHNGMVLSPNCSCASPLMFLLQFYAPSFSTINLPRINTFKASLASHLSLTTNGIWVESANFTDNHFLDLDMRIFPFGSIPFSRKKIADILDALSLQRFLLDNFGPYHLKMIILPPSTVSTKKNIDRMATIGIWIGIALALLILAGMTYYAVWQKRRADKAELNGKLFTSWAPAAESFVTPQIKGARHYSLSNLKKATNNFSRSKEIGSGGYGKVYKGALSTGELVAIKRAQEGCIQGTIEFKNEIELLSRVHHKNLVDLLGFCCEKGEQMLVYEYLPNGTLRDQIFGHNNSLSWQKRIEIALGSAKGLAYLHDLVVPPIIHRDIKSANILLDGQFNAKVADFGLGKLAPVGETAHADGHISTQVKGTLGYLDPEYYMTQKLTEKSDVYSFGVVLLELITARPPIEKGVYIVRQMRDAWIEGDVEKVQALLDPSLGSYCIKDLESFLNLSLCMVEESSVLRPSMSEALKVLEVILGRICSSNSFDNTSWAENTRSENNDIDLHSHIVLSPSHDSSFHFSNEIGIGPKVVAK